jgi:hypothetical protein
MLRRVQLHADSFPRISSCACGNITRKQFRMSDTCAVCGGSAGDMTRAGISASEGGGYVETLSGMKPGALSDLWGVGVGKEGGGVCVNSYVLNFTTFTRPLSLP